MLCWMGIRIRDFDGFSGAGRRVHCSSRRSVTLVISIHCASLRNIRRPRAWENDDNARILFHER